MTWVLPVLLAVFICAAAKWIRDRRAIHSTWERLGIKGPKSSSLLFGNLLDIMKHGRRKVQEGWTQTYGKIYGYYEGTVPILSVADPDVVKEILIKQFNNFDYRMTGADPKDKFVGMFGSQGPKWKRLRDISSPTFSGKKMKMMSPLVDDSIHKLMGRFEQRVKKGEAFDIYDDFKCLTLDVIASTVFSYETDTFNTDDSIFLKKFKILFDSLSLQRMSTSRKVLFTLNRIFPLAMRPVRFFLPRMMAPPNQWFLDLAKRMIEDRQQSGEVRSDYLQLMINLQKRATGQPVDASEESSEAETSTVLAKQLKFKYLEMEEMQGQTFSFLAAGYETTATTLAFAAYYLALYPEVQNKLRKEINEYFPTKGQNINYESVQKLPYLEMFFCEVSRLAQIAHLAVNRICANTTKIGDLTIPKGTSVQVNMADIHMNPDLWGPEPVDQLVPERFSPERKGERHSMAYLPFGGGPRNCIGMRFAIMEAKMAIINVLQRFNIDRCDETEVPLQCNQDGVHGPMNGVRVKMTKCC